MEINKFNVLVDNRCEQVKKTLKSKASEYATSIDRLHNFNVAARILGVPREAALLGMMVKHIVSVFDMIQDPCNVSQDMIDEKLGDWINYLFLLEACFVDTMEGL